MPWAKANNEKKNQKFMLAWLCSMFISMLKPPYVTILLWMLHWLENLYYVDWLMWLVHILCVHVYCVFYDSDSFFLVNVTTFLNWNTTVARGNNTDIQQNVYQNASNYIFTMHTQYIILDILFDMFWNFWWYNEKYWEQKFSIQHIYIQCNNETTTKTIQCGDDLWINITYIESWCMDVYLYKMWKH